MLTYLFRFGGTIAGASFAVLGMAQLVLDPVGGKSTITISNAGGTIASKTYMGFGSASLSGSSISSSGGALPAVQAIAVPAQNQNASLLADLTYQFAIIGGQVGDVVPIKISGHLKTTSIPLGTIPGQAGLSFQGLLIGPKNYSVYGNNVLDPVLSTVALSGSAVNVEESAAAVASFASDGSPIQGSAFVDPSIVIDPTWAAGHPGYSVQYSPGITPEPMSLAVVGIGLAFVAGQKRFGSKRAKKLGC